MPNYSYVCNKCKLEFEMFFYIKDYQITPKCYKCSSSKTQRLYIKDVLTQGASVKKSDTELKTLGDLANRNRDRMSEDEKNTLQHKHNSYKEESNGKLLPKNMKRLKKSQKIKWTENGRHNTRRKK